jgi:hypothetical protein
MFLKPYQAPAFDTATLHELGEKNRERYSLANPFKHIVLDDFLPPKQANQALRDFPNTESHVWLDWRKRNTINQPKKQGIGHASRLNGVSSNLVNLLNSFNSYPFLNFLEQLTGIEKLLPDPYLHGGGLHQILNGGKLDIHCDFNHLKNLDLYRRINVLYYLNKDWKNEYQGHLELWSNDMKRREKVIAPTFNRLVIFNTDKSSFHGHPTPLKLPPNITRKSIALYYYTARPVKDRHYDTKTDWRETT